MTFQPERTAIHFSLKDQVGSLNKVLNLVEKEGFNMSDIHSRPVESNNGMSSHYEFDVQLSEDYSSEQLAKLKTELDKICSNVRVYGTRSEDIPWFPKKISDLDKFAAKTLDAGADLESDHPGFKDEEYRKRRCAIVEMAQKYRHGDRIPRIDYTPQEVETWGTCFRKLRHLYASHACRQMNEVFPLLEKYCGYSEDNIPQLEDISNFLKQATGFSLRPVQGLLTPRDFLNGLAFRVFHSTQYIRHHSKPLYTPEPDVVHELMGHVPLFANPSFAEFSQEIGLASLGASDEEIEELATVYWFTVEFGLCKEVDSSGKEVVKAFGAGLLSSFGELEYCLTDKPETRPFDPKVAAKTKYPITEYQPVYFVADSFESAKLKVREFSRTKHSRPFQVVYNPYTQSVEVLNNVRTILGKLKGLNIQAEFYRKTLSNIL